ncbi:BA14K family protein [Sinorhizobium numidicum]|uniref:Lectin-like protein BA14k n=1 Tax=Sinorhizobium numidicum TaxID=680248 RepID=A0ABY8CWX8_9HYPH|nr:BA14K family protein [Sinorhizobium numidicum]WEX76490.1 BA14K family protein [Sinorhizobium numidicum]WEX83151.1 BA14K family protein [Sinorhizobium numidicum]
MNKFVKAAVLSVVAAAMVLPTFGIAEAGHRHRHHNGDAWAAGAVGLVTGALIGGAIASQPRYNERVYIDPEPEYYEPRPVYQPRPVYRPVYRPVVVDYDVEPWTPAWYRYCSQRYRSFDPDTGTFIGYDGRSHFCTAG